MNKDPAIKKILFVGLNTVDLQFHINRYPRSNTKTKASYGEVLVGGPATNAAIACAFLGNQVDLCTPVGRHTFTEFIQNELAHYAIRLIDPIAGSTAQPVLAGIITSQQNCERTIFSYNPQNQLKIPEELNINLKDYSLVLFDGFHPELFLHLAKEARIHNISTVLDGGSWKPMMEDLIRYIDIAICSSDFFVPGTSTTQSVLESLKNRGIRSAAITRGERTILYTKGRQIGEIAVPQTAVKDTMGAGDIFHGAFCHFFGHSGAFAESLERAGKVASCSCRTRGTRSWMENFRKSKS